MIIKIMNNSIFYAPYEMAKNGCQLNIIFV